MRVQSQEGCSLVCERNPDVVKLISVALIDIDIDIWRPKYHHVHLLRVETHRINKVVLSSVGSRSTGFKDLTNSHLSGLNV